MSAGKESNFVSQTSHYWKTRRDCKNKWRILGITAVLVISLIKCGLYYVKGINNYSQEVEEQSTTKSYFSSRQLLSFTNLPTDRNSNCTPVAINNFPRDLFSDNQRRHGWVLIHTIVALYMFLALSIVCDEYFVPCLECIADALHLSADVAGATFMAAGSSAPELATTIIGVFIAKDDIGLGAVVGSADYNVMFVISACALCAKTIIYLNWWPLVRDSIAYMFCIVILAYVISDGEVYWYESIVLLFLYGMYVLLMYFNPRLNTFFSGRYPSCCPIVAVEDPDRMGLPMDQQCLYSSVGMDQMETSTNGGSSDIIYTKPTIKSGVGDKRGTDIELTQQTLRSSNNNTVGMETTGSGKKALLEPCTLSYVESKFTGEGLNDYTVAVVKTDTATPPVEIGGYAGSRTSLASSTDSVGELRLPGSDSRSLNVSGNGGTSQPGGGSGDGWDCCGGCFQILRWPDGEESSTFSKIIHTLGFPLKLLLAISTPDCRLEAWRSWFWATFVVSCFWITIYSYIMIWMITIVGYTARIPDTVMGLTFIAAGSSVPDVIASVIVVREGQGDMAVSNAIGSNIFDILICMGLPWFIQSLIIQKSVPIYSKGLVWATVTLLSTVGILLITTHLNRWRLTKPYGCVLMVVYLAYLVLCTLYELNVFGEMHPIDCKMIDDNP